MGRMAFRSILGDVSKLELRKEAPYSASDSTEELGNLEKVTGAIENDQESQSDNTVGECLPCIWPTEVQFSSSYTVPRAFQE